MFINCVSNQITFDQLTGFHYTWRAKRAIGGCLILVLLKPLITRNMNMMVMQTSEVKENIIISPTSQNSSRLFRFSDIFIYIGHKK
jgi:hypothetical protein